MASKLFRGLSIFTISFLTIILLTSVSANDMSSNFTNSDVSNSFDFVQFASAEGNHPPKITIDKFTNKNGFFPITITGGLDDIKGVIPTEGGEGGIGGNITLETDISYIISEDPLGPGWETSVTCTKGTSLPDATFTFSAITGDHIVCTFVNTFTEPEDSDVSKKAQKQAVIDSLTGDMPTKSSDKLTRHIEHSLRDKLWEDDNTPDSKYGKQVFDEEKKAVKALVKALKKADEPFASVISSAIISLVEIDRMLAQDAIDKAELLSGDMKELDKSDKEMDKADQEIAKGHPDHAIDKFKKAWEHAQHAIKKAS